MRVPFLSLDITKALLQEQVVLTSQCGTHPSSVCFFGLSVPERISHKLMQLVLAWIVFGAHRFGLCLKGSMHIGDDGGLGEAWGRVGKDSRSLFGVAWKLSSGTETGSGRENM